MKRANPACPCGTGLKYAACCRPFHRGEEPQDAERLMRSRFSAYALGEAEYLWRTLHPANDAHAEGRDAHLASIRAARQKLRYTRLRVLDRDLPSTDDVNTRTARVLFHAEIYEQGRERSFLELSTFERTVDGWRYLSGINRSAPANTPGVDALRIPTCGL